MSTTNTLGFGSLSSVAWTDMTGTNLQGQELANVNADVGNANIIAASLQDFIKAATNGGLSAFSLAQFETSAKSYFGATSVTGNKGSDAASDWAGFIRDRTGTLASQDQALSLSQWRSVGAELQEFAARQASKRSPNEGGGVKNVNGHWYVNGQQLSLLDVYMAVRVNQVSNFDDSLNIYMQELNRNNNFVKAANEWLNKLRGLKPTDTSSTPSIPFADISTFSDKWGFNPITVFMPSTGTKLSGNYLKWDQYIEETKSYVDTKNTENQTAQQKLEQMTNRRGEVLEGLTSFGKSQSQTGQSFARNLG